MLRFLAVEDICHLPQLDDAEFAVVVVQVENVNLQLALCSKFQPRRLAFLDFNQPHTSVRRYVVRNFACVTVWSMTAINRSKSNELWIMEPKPGKSMSTVEYNMGVDFDTP